MHTSQPASFLEMREQVVTGDGAGHSAAEADAEGSAEQVVNSAGKGSTGTSGSDNGSGGNDNAAPLSNASQAANYTRLAGFKVALGW